MTSGPAPAARPTAARRTEARPTGDRSSEARAAARTCCRRPMTSIEVTSSLAAPGASLALHSCAGCGRHVWERDGVDLDRAAVLGVVRDRIAEGPAPRVPRPRRARPAAAVPAQDRRDLQQRLAGFSVHGR